MCGVCDSSNLVPVADETRARDALGLERRIAPAVS
jgi:hypothetical protein